MSDDLVKRLREYAQVAHMAAAWGFAGEGFVMEKAADRIEELEAKLARVVKRMEDIINAGLGYDSALYVETVSLAARTTLAELTGGKDE